MRLRRSLFTIVNVAVLLSSISILAYATTLSATHTGIHIHEPFQNLQALTEDVNIFPGQQAIANFTVLDAGPVGLTIRPTVVLLPTGQGVTATLPGINDAGTITLFPGLNQLGVTVIAGSNAIAGDYNVTLIMTRV